MSRNLPWFRMYSELLSDRKIKRVQRAVPKASKMEIVGFWTALLCLANDSNERGQLLIGSTPVTIEDLEDETDLSPEKIESLLSAFEQNEMIEHERIITLSNWKERQPNSDSNAEKQKRYRDRKKDQKQEKKQSKVTPNGNKNGALRNGYSLDKEKEEDKEREEEINFSSAPADPVHVLFSPLERFLSIPFEKKPHHKYGKEIITSLMVGHESKFQGLWDKTVFFMDYCKMPSRSVYEDDLFDLLELLEIWPETDEKLLSFIADFERSMNSKPWPSQVIGEVRSWHQPKIQDTGEDLMDTTLKWLGNRRLPYDWLPKNLEQNARRLKVNRSGLSEFEAQKLAKRIVNYA